MNEKYYAKLKAFHKNIFLFVCLYCLTSQIIKCCYTNSRYSDNIEELYLNRLRSLNFPLEIRTVNSRFSENFHYICN